MEETKGRVFTSVDEFCRGYFPNSVLERLKDKLCSHLGLNHDHDGEGVDWIVKKYEEPNTGSIDLINTSFFRGSVSAISDLVREFYKDEGYTVDEHKQKGIKYSITLPGEIVEVKNNDKCYWALVAEYATSYNIIVMVSPFDSINFDSIKDESGGK